jgi:diadenosine tetraphosphate (Ap4A) HIT family hydrolase
MFGMSCPIDNHNLVLKKKKIEEKTMNNKYDRTNVFSKILRSEIKCDKVLENEHALAFLDINPQAPIHILIIPKNEYIDFHDFTENGSSQEVTYFWKLVCDVINSKNISDTGFRIIANSGVDGNQDVPHFHVHLLGGKNLGKMIN